MTGRRAWGGRHSMLLVRLTLATYGTRCHLCGTTGATTADHLVPRSKGGGDDLANLRPAHLSCNSARGAMDLGEWRASHGFTDSDSANVNGRTW